MIYRYPMASLALRCFLVTLGYSVFAFFEGPSAYPVGMVLVILGMTLLKFKELNKNWIWYRMSSLLANTIFLLFVVILIYNRYLIQSLIVNVWVLVSLCVLSNLILFIEFEARCKGE